jgi:uncharacterized membrane protein
LSKYQVKYVVIGELERKYYAANGLAKFGAMPDLRLVYDTDGVQIYEVVS